MLLSNVKVIAHPIDAAGGRHALALLQLAGINTTRMRWKGGHLHDDLAEGRVPTVSLLDTWLCEFAAVEQGAMLQNLALMAAALGLVSHVGLLGLSAGVLPTAVWVWLQESAQARQRG